MSGRVGSDAASGTASTANWPCKHGSPSGPPVGIYTHIHRLMNAVSMVVSTVSMVVSKGSTVSMVVSMGSMGA